MQQVYTIVGNLFNCDIQPIPGCLVYALLPWALTSGVDISPGGSPAGDPICWLAPGDFIPMIPGGVSVTAIGTGFLVEKLGSHIKVLFSPRADDAIISAGIRADC